MSPETCGSSTQLTRLDGKKSRKVHTPASVKQAPKECLLINDAAFFDGNGTMPFSVASISRP